MYPSLINFSVQVTPFCDEIAIKLELVLPCKYNLGMSGNEGAFQNIIE